MTQPSIKSGLKRLLEAFRRLDIEYMIVGSLASSVHGLARATMDVDIVADLNQAKIEALAADIEREFYADVSEMKEASQRGRAFNLIHYASSYKFDVFPVTRHPFAQAEFARRRAATLTAEGAEPAVEFLVATAEDTILSKLRWYQASGETSQRQWGDAQGIARVWRGRLDTAYLERWARELNLGALLARLFASLDA